MRRILKSLYVIVRTLSIFGLPVTRTFRNYIYREYFDAERLFVSDRVLIVSAHISKSARIQFGRQTELGKDAYIDYSGGVVIGDNVAISEGAKIFTHNHHVMTGYSNWHLNELEFSSLIIESDAWIGSAAIVLPAVTHIGRGAIVGAGAVLTKNADAYGVYVGNPAVKVAERCVNKFPEGLTNTITT